MFKTTFLYFILIFHSILLSRNLWAITWSINDPCSDKIIYQGDWNVTDMKQSVGRTTIEILNGQLIPFEGTEGGIVSILGTPKGLAAMQPLEDGSIRYFGWCYSVDGKAPDVMPDAYYFNNNNAHLTWWYGYSTEVNGEWIGYCDPSHLAKWKKLCPSL